VLHRLTPGPWGYWLQVVSSAAIILLIIVSIMLTIIMKGNVHGFTFKGNIFWALLILVSGRCRGVFTAVLQVERDAFNGLR
jgi:hypothetical protein